MSTHLSCARVEEAKRLYALLFDVVSFMIHPVPYRERSTTVSTLILIIAPMRCVPA